MWNDTMMTSIVDAEWDEVTEAEMNDIVNSLDIEALVMDENK